MSGSSGEPAAKGHVVIVEDEALLAMEVEDELAAQGYTAVYAPAGATDAWIQAQAPTAAVVNLNLGSGQDGRDVIRRLRAAFPGLPVVVLTGYMASSDAANLRGLGGPTVRVHKPWPRGEVADHLADLTRRPGHDPAMERRKP